MKRVQASPKPYIDINTDLRKAAKYDFEKDFLNLINNSVCGETMENVRKHRHIKLVTKKKKLFGVKAELPYIKVFRRNFVGYRNEKTCLFRFINNLIRTIMYEFWYDYVKPKYGENPNCCNMHTYSFIQLHIKTYDMYKDIAEDIETRLGTSTY